MVLAALVLTLEGEAPPEPKGLRGFFYGLLQEVAPEVHDQGENPFALGFGGKEGAYWARFSLLQEGLYARLAPRLFALEGKEVRLGKPFRVRGVLQEGHPWAGVSTYARLFQGEALPDLPLRFASPTFFRRKGVHYPLPEPRLVVESLLRRLEAFGPLKAPEGVREALLERTTVRWFEGKTLKAETEVEAVGFVGKVVYHLPRATEEEARWLQALGRFAFYSGVGAKTGLGYGRARVG
ncbi:MAG: CRISPR-associated endoribonuclease Cas6 [Thermus sp.]|uniref:CRISPR-associated endoribonuclease Cas6 n=1 Tax=Thermus sp. TaxID=275 RepID=UPI0025D7A81F|nr:CRISPR-associated endoribonuclease Cas6 [Thermus sp.]MCS6867401.1 CRISPR-associated endoribonuclease Cas6 [Thermus sp.]MCS7219493.1 CRISPR-associated endoribonuclease Cas6 [Thermus sp.]MCX7849445.1 CRISPR-associated endoribonuclease Cas6 [Thermus sp.]MDW8018197.1 CRISPR-associated endoribonuclease Cas6 [Thermus sp.]MDW8356812.1 CRISPR-associated endoribonuclease Cas6 [Thermus sp.]